MVQFYNPIYSSLPGAPIIVEGAVCWILEYLEGVFSPPQRRVFANGELLDTQ